MTQTQAQIALSKRWEKNKEQYAKWQSMLDRYPHLFAELEAAGIEVAFDSGLFTYVAIRFTGDAEKFRTVWRILRSNGFEPDLRPKAEDKHLPEFATWFKHSYDGIQSEFWFSFTSSVCRRKKIGTRMVEEDIYEIDCTPAAATAAETSEMGCPDGHSE